MRCRALKPNPVFRLTKNPGVGLAGAKVESRGERNKCRRPSEASYAGFALERNEAFDSRSPRAGSPDRHVRSGRQAFSSVGLEVEFIFCSARFLRLEAGLAGRWGTAAVLLFARLDPGIFERMVVFFYLRCFESLRAVHSVERCARAIQGSSCERASTIRRLANGFGGWDGVAGSSAGGYVSGVVSMAG